MPLLLPDPNYVSEVSAKNDSLAYFAKQCGVHGYIFRVRPNQAFLEVRSLDWRLRTYNLSDGSAYCVIPENERTAYLRAIFKNRDTREAYVDGLSWHLPVKGSRWLGRSEINTSLPVNGLV